MGNARRVIATAAAFTTVLIPSGCSNAFTGGAVELPTYGPVTSPPPRPPGSAILPANFPRSIPVARGLYRVEPGPVSGALSLIVTDVAPDALNQARHMLLDAGYQIEPVLGQDMFVGTHYVVTVTGDPTPGRGYQLTYTAFETDSISGIPSMPQLRIPALLPSPPTPAAADTERAR